MIKISPTMLIWSGWFLITAGSWGNAIATHRSVAVAVAVADSEQNSLDSERRKTDLASDSKRQESRIPLASRRSSSSDSDSPARRAFKKDIYGEVLIGSDDLGGAASVVTLAGSEVLRVEFDSCKEIDLRLFVCLVNLPTGSYDVVFEPKERSSHPVGSRTHRIVVSPSPETPAISVLKFSDRDFMGCLRITVVPSSGVPLLYKPGELPDELIRDSAGNVTFRPGLDVDVDSILYDNDFIMEPDDVQDGTYTFLEIPLGAYSISFLPIGGHDPPSHVALQFWSLGWNYEIEGDFRSGDFFLRSTDRRCRHIVREYTPKRE